MQTLKRFQESPDKCRGSRAATETHTYTYGDSGWKDLLTAYDGQAISYDAIGNPTAYLGKAMTWEGRRLISVSGAGHASTYAYNSDGCRTEKTVDGAAETFFYQDGVLCYEKRDGREYYYGYGANGTLAAIAVYSGGTCTFYHVICNVSDDLTGIYDSQGTLAAWYVYDAWGNLVSLTDGNGNAVTDESHIGNLNRIRYRGTTGTGRRGSII